MLNGVHSLQKWTDICDGDEEPDKDDANHKQKRRMLLL